MGEVKIVYKGESCTVDIEDISQEGLQECFSLLKPPIILVDETDKIFDFKHWRSKLKVGSIYRIKEQSKTDKEEVVKEDIGMDDTLRGIVLNSLIASKAVYKMTHEEDDGKLLKDYLYEQKKNHYFDYIISSKHGKNFYLIAKEIDENRIYVAFRGSKDLLDWKCKLQVKLPYFLILMLFLYFFTFMYFALNEFFTQIH